MSKKRQRELAQDLQDEPGLDFWGGSTWAMFATIVSPAGSSSTHEYNITPGEDNEFQFLYGNFFNGDTAARTLTMEMLDAVEGNIIGRFTVVSIPLANQHALPSNLTGSEETLASKWIISGTMSLHLSIPTVNIAQDTAFGMVARIRGKKPTILLQA